MSATRNTTFTFGLMLLILAAGRSAIAQTACGDAGCDAACQSGGASGGSADALDGFHAQDFNHEPGCRYCGDSSCLEPDPIFGAFTPYFRDLCERCAGCTLKADADVLLMHRATPGTSPLLLDPNTSEVLFDASQLEFPYSGGQRLSLTALDCEGWGLEVNYFGIDSWSVQRNDPGIGSVIPGGSANLVADSALLVPVSAVQFQATSFLYSVEINARKPLFGKISGLLGFRWLDLTDRYLATGPRSDTGGSVAEFVQTRNHLFGAQLGADGMIGQLGNRCRINAFVKAGVFYNGANAAAYLEDPDVNGNLAVSNSQKQAAFFGESGVVGCVQITEHLSARAGYEVMFINGIAQPGNQLSGTNLAAGTLSLDTTSGLFYHGANFGLEAVW
jgi:hypothetical protein